MINKKIGRSLILCVCCLVTFSCVKDIDLSQTEDIGLSPDIETDLLIYSVTAQDFKDPETSQFQQVIRDTVRLEFLDDDYIQNDLTSAELHFKNTNSIPEKFSTRILFLSENNRRQFSVEYPIRSGSEESPSTAEAVEVLGEDRISLLKNSIKMVVELTAESGTEKFEGQLDFASKGLFKFDF